MATAMPEVTEGTRWRNVTWFVRGRAFAWERPLSKADIARYGDATPPAGPLLAVAVADLGEKEAVLASSGPAVFTIAHFDDYPALLVALDEVDPDELQELVEDGWAACAPPELVAAYLDRGR